MFLPSTSVRFPVSDTRPQIWWPEVKGYTPDEHADWLDIPTTWFEGVLL